MKHAPIKVLLVEDNLDDISLIEEAVAEIEEGRFSRGWMPACELIQVDSVSEALELLQRERFDVILLDVAARDGPRRNGLLQFRSQMPDIPVIALVSAGEEPLAVSLVRQGAQDYLIKSELDCIPLARAIRCSIERHRLWTALRNLSFVDDLTGLYTWAGFLSVAKRQWQLAQRAGLEVRVYLVGLDVCSLIGEPPSAQEKDLVLIKAADVLQDFFEETAIIARIDATQFVVASLHDGRASSHNVAARLRHRIEDCIEDYGPIRAGHPRLKVVVQVVIAHSAAGTTLEGLLQAAELALCDNNRNNRETPVKELHLIN